MLDRLISLFTAQYLLLMATYFAFITVQGWIKTKRMWTLISYSWCRLTSLVVTSSFSDTFTISRSFSSSKDRTRSMYTANLSFRCCKSCFSCRREIRVGDRGVEAAGWTVSRLGVAVAITLFVVLLCRLVSKLEEMGIAFLLESCSVYLIAESLSVNKSWAHGQQCLPKLNQSSESKMAATAYITAPKEHHASALARADGKLLFAGGTHLLFRGYFSSSERDSTVDVTILIRFDYTKL